MQQEAPRGANKEAIEGHRLFCKTMADISGIVGHTCGVERAGKCYGLVMSSLRKSMHAARAAKCVYVFANYGLLEHKHEAGDGALGTRTCALLCTPASRVLCSACTGYHAFQAALNDQQGDGTAGDEGDVVSAIIRRGRLIVEDANSSGSESEDGGGNEGGDGGSGDAGKPKEVAWALPEGFELGTEPAKLDVSLKGQMVYMRWATYGWQLGKIYDVIDRSTPRLLKKFNFRVMWMDNTKGPRPRSRPITTRPAPTLHSTRGS